MTQEEFEYSLLQADMYFKKGNDAFKEKEFEKAKILFHTAIEKHPHTDMHKAILMLGITFYFLEDYESSLENLLYSYSKSDYNCNYYIALNYSQLQDYHKTIDFCKRCIEIDGTQDNILQLLNKAMNEVNNQKKQKFNTEEEYIVEQIGQYIGNFINGKREGSGSIVFPDGRKYVGEFKNDMYCGHGIFTFENGEKYIGEFKDNLYNGDGTLIFANGSKYHGEFKNGKRNGKGIMNFYDGTNHEGNYEDDLINGFGKMTYVSGNIYEGEFLFNKMHGKGKYIFSNGNIWEGEFYEGKQNGFGILTTLNGEKYNSNYKNGVRILIEKII